MTGGMAGIVRAVALAATWVVTGASISATATPEGAVPTAPPALPAPAAPTGAGPDADDLLGLAVRGSHEVGY
ncbi:MAG TPA: 2-oxoglutarate dehydrogenase, E2 component, dihydrolipoamide succinyltransferase, partial [Actinomycetota bacterium]